MLVLEVERKFSYLGVKSLLRDGGNPPFQSLTYRGKKTFHDIYYDKSDLLSSNGIWVRQRDGRWQAKIRRGGDRTNSKFEELSTPEEISKYLKGLGVRSNEGSNFGLEQMASFLTTRESWIADRDFTIVQDVTDFGHTVGEVELEACLDRSAGSSREMEQYRNRKMAEMDARIAAFMRQYSWAFGVGIPKGKLTAYFERLDRK
ncbi:hypothetical protein HFD88_008685 [Aspergillus terreus]|nr:hypothetical protein HFD88_008685 [Aspergillus terreus]